MIISMYFIIIFCGSKLLIIYWYHENVQPPASFLATMEEYVSNAPLASMVQRNQVWILEVLKVCDICFSTIAVSFLGSLLSATMYNKQAVSGYSREVTFKTAF